MPGLRRAAVAVLLVVWLGLHVAVPAVGLVRDKPVRWSWQMFSALSGHPTFVLVGDDGEEESRRLGQLLPRVRADVRYERHVPPHLCATRSDLVEVRIEWDDRSETHRCRP